MQTIPMDLARELLDRKGAWEAFSELPEILQQGHVLWVEAAPTTTDRDIRVKVAVDVMMRNRYERHPLMSTAV